MIDIAKKIAKLNYYSRLLGIDLGMDNNGRIRIIEINSVNNEINFYQMNNGPLFGDYTKEIIDYCKKNQISYCFDYQM